jgi:circadian clock protein KaiB
MCKRYLLKLYVSGDTARTRIAIANLQEFCQQQLPEETKIEIIDILKNPQIAEEKKILITPTLVKEFPLPQERIIGDLSNREVVAFALNIQLKYPQSN